MKTLALKIETIRVLSSSDLDGVIGGAGKLSSVFQGGTANETHVSSAKPVHHHKHQPAAHVTSSVQHLSSVLHR